MKQGVSLILAAVFTQTVVVADEVAKPVASPGIQGCKSIVQLIDRAGETAFQKVTVCSLPDGRVGEPQFLDLAGCKPTSLNYFDGQKWKHFNAICQTKEGTAGPEVVNWAERKIEI